VRASDGLGLRDVTGSVFFRKGDFLRQDCNSGFILREGDAVFVDTSYYEDLVRETVEASRGRRGHEPGLLVNTHHHLDHTKCNHMFNCEVLAEESAVELHDRFNRGEGSGPGVRYPSILFKDRLILRGSPQIELLHLGGHTSDSIIVVVPDESVAFVGDLIFSETHLFLKYSDIGDWLRALRVVEGLDVEHILPGHGGVCRVDDVAVVVEYLTRFRDGIRRLKGEGLTVDEIISAQEQLRLPKPKHETEWDGFIVEESVRAQYSRV